MSFFQPKGVQALVDRMDAVLLESGSDIGEQYDSFVTLQRQIGLLHGDRPLCRHLRPLLLPKASYDSIQRAAGLVTSALEVVARRAFADPAIASEIGLGDDELALAAISPGYPDLLAVGRLDVLPGESGFHFIEMNAESPAGIADQILVERALAYLSTLTPLLRRRELRSPRPHEGLLSGLRRVYAAWNAGRSERRPLESIAIVDFATVDTAAEFGVLAERFRAAGYRAEVVVPDDLTYDGDRLRSPGGTVDLVYRRVISRELIERGGYQQPLLAAYRDRAVCVANSFRTTAMNKKAAFAVLSDPRFEEWFTAEQRSAIALHVPWTRRLSAGTTTWKGSTADVRDLVLRERERFVLKPNDAYGGRGVIPGWTVSQSEWEDAVRDAEEDFVVQERKTPRTVRLPVFENGAVVHEDVFFDLCPFIFAGRVEGMMVRLSSSAIGNVSTGASVTALCVVSSAPAEEVMHV